MEISWEFEKGTRDWSLMVFAADKRGFGLLVPGNSGDTLVKRIQERESQNVYFFHYFQERERTLRSSNRLREPNIIALVSVAYRSRSVKETDWR